MRMFRQVAAKLLFLLALHGLLGGVISHAGSVQCDLRNIHVTADDPHDARVACEAAERATTFLQTLGLDVSAEVYLEIVPALDTQDTDTIAGYLEATQNRGVMLNYREFRKFGTWLRVPITREIYRGLVAHEVAHVIAARNFRMPTPTIQAQEYIAYVTTLATLEAAQRARIMQQYDGDGFDTEQQMNPTIYLCDPMRFGVEAYRHFLKQGDKAGYFGAILTGRVLAGW